MLLNFNNDYHKLGSGLRIWKFWGMLINFIQSLLLYLLLLDGDIWFKLALGAKIALEIIIVDDDGW